MTVEIYWLDGEKNEPLLSFDQSDYSEVFSAFETLKRRAGVFIDPYGDTRLSPQHAAILAAEIRCVTTKAPIVQGLADVLETSAKQDDWLLFVGD